MREMLQEISSAGITLLLRNLGLHWGLERRAETIGLSCFPRKLG